MPLPAPPTISTPWDATNVNRNDIPVASQIGIVNGAASWTDGFPPLTFLPLTAGGVAPDGADMNGVLYALSAHVAALNAGQLYQYNAVLSAAIGGYSLGAVLQQAADPTAFWVSAVNANITNPDAGGAGWFSSKALYATSAPAAGAHNDQALAGTSDYYLDIDTTAGAMNYTGFVSQRDGQRLIISNIGANLLTLNSLNAGSAAANRLRLPADLGLVQNQTAVLRYIAGVSRWVSA